MRTRAKPSAKGAAPAKPTTSETPTITLAPSESEPPKLAVLPKGLSADARVVSLPEPRSSTPKRYLVCPELGFFEFTNVTVPRSTPRSWLLRPAVQEQPKDPGLQEGPRNGERSLEGSGYLVKEPDLLIATPVDAALLLLPALAPPTSGDKQMFLTADDHIDAWAVKSSHARRLARHSRVKSIMESGIAAVCDNVDAGEEKMYRLSNQKLARHLLQKSKRASAASLPNSMEEHFVKEALKAPFFQTAMSDAIPQADSVESQLSIDSGYGSAASVSEDVTSLAVATQAQLTPSEDVIQLQRLRTALDFILSSYVPTQLQVVVRDHISKHQLVDYSPLDAYLARLQELKKQSQALRNLSENISRKRGVDEDDEAAEIRAQKKQRKEEEEANKKNETRALKQLKKADTSGMKKLSSFFAKKPAK